MTKYTFFLLALVGLAGCRDTTTAARPANLMASNDFEELEGWTGSEQLLSLSKEKAHSGAYSMRVGPGVDYSNGFIGALGKFSPVRVSQVQVKGWVMVPSAPSAASLIIQLMAPGQTNGKPALWDASPLDKAAATPNQWVELDKTITMPADVSPDATLYVYLWNGGSGSIAYLDDVQILRAK